MTYPEAVVSDAAAPRPRTKLLVEADDLMDEVLTNLALKLFILLRSKLTVFKKENVICVFTQRIWDENVLSN